MATKTSANFALQLAAGTLNWATDDIRILLTDSTSALTENSAFLASATLGEVTGTGYARVSMLGRSVDASAVGDIVRFLANDPFWGTMTPASTVTQAIIYKHVSSDADSIPLIFVDLGSTVVSGDTLQITWPGTGVTYIRFGAVA